MECKICGNISNNKIVNAKEMMFGYRDDFEYFECGNCGHLSLINIPEDLDKYYPTNYYSYSNGFISLIMYYLNYKVYKHIIYNKSLIGNILLKLDSEDRYFTSIQIGKLIKKLIDRGNINKDSLILDVGCGAGHFLKIFERLGFTNLYGLDIDTPNDTGNVQFIESPFEQYSSDLKFDLIFLNDSFEHMDNHHEVIEKLKGLLGVNGRIILTMPIISYTFKKYGANWVHLDAPRHLNIHTLKSFQMLLLNNKFELLDTIFNSDFTSFLRSEEYQNNIASIDKRAYKQIGMIFFNLTNLKKSTFTKQDLIKFKNKAKQLNSEQLGDHAIFIFK